MARPSAPFAERDSEEGAFIALPSDRLPGGRSDMQGARRPSGGRGGCCRRSDRGGEAGVGKPKAPSSAHPEMQSLFEISRRGCGEACVALCLIREGKPRVQRASTPPVRSRPRFYSPRTASPAHRPCPDRQALAPPRRKLPHGRSRQGAGG